MSCGPGCWWEVRVLRFGLSRNGVFWSSAVAPALVERLRDAPVGFLIREGRLAHRPDGLLDAEDIVGRVESIRAGARDITATVRLADDAERVRAGLLAMERDGQLTTLGVSPVADVRLRIEQSAGRVIRRVMAVDAVHSLDIVSWPSGDGACFLRSVPPAERQIGGAR